MRLCPFRDCGDTIPSHKFGCRKHWFSLSEAHKQRIWDGYLDYQAQRINVRQLAELQKQVLAEHYSAPGTIGEPAP